MSNITIGDFPGKVVLPKKMFKSRGKVCMCVSTLIHLVLPRPLPLPQDAPVNDLRYLPHDYVFTADKPGRGEAWSTGKATPTKK